MGMSYSRVPAFDTMNPVSEWDADESTHLCRAYRHPDAYVRLWLLSVTTLIAVAAPAVSERFTFDGSWSRSWELTEGQAIELQVRLEQPSALPANARIEAVWDGPDLQASAWDGDRRERGVESTADWAKVLHALDPDVHTVYRAPQAGTYTLRLETVTDRAQPLGEIPHDTGLAPVTTPLPARTPSVSDIAISIELRPSRLSLTVRWCWKPSPITRRSRRPPCGFQDALDEQVLYVIGGADELEYYNNARVGMTPDDWYRIEYKGSEPKFLSANLQVVGTGSERQNPFLQGGSAERGGTPRAGCSNSYDFANFNPIPYVHPPATVVPGPVPVYTYEEGRALNERGAPAGSLLPHVRHAPRSSLAGPITCASKPINRTTSCRCVSSTQLPTTIP